MYAAFTTTVWDYYHDNARSMPWRDDPSFYNVLVSEIMLQQTQVDRVRVKYAEFMAAFASIEALARAPLSEVVRLWQGLGYNRRARFLHEAAKLVEAGHSTNTVNHLVKLPGVGKNTAGAIMNYVYNSPTPFVETNIRTVYFYHFFTNSQPVSDADVLELVTQTIDHERPREWFWALMDYGAYLKKQGAGRLDMSRHYRKQTPLRGSVRELRGRLIARLAQSEVSLENLRAIYAHDDRFTLAYEGLLRDGLLALDSGIVHLTD